MIQGCFVCWHMFTLSLTRWLGCDQVYTLNRTVGEIEESPSLDVDNIAPQYQDVEILSNEEDPTDFGPNHISAAAVMHSGFALREDFFVVEDEMEGSLVVPVHEVEMTAYCRRNRGSTKSGYGHIAPQYQDVEILSNEKDPTDFGPNHISAAAVMHSGFALREDFFAVEDEMEGPLVVPVHEVEMTAYCRLNRGITKSGYGHIAPQYQDVEILSNEEDPTDFGPNHISAAAVMHSEDFFAVEDEMEGPLVVPVHEVEMTAFHSELEYLLI